MFKKAKIISSLTLVLVLIASLFGCGSSNTASQAPSAGANTASTAKKSGGYKVALVNSSLGDTYRVQLQAEFVQKADELKSKGVISDYFITNANGDISKQVSDMKDMITKKVDGIIIAAVSPSALSPVVEQAMNAGIKVISFNMLVDTNNVTGKVYIDDSEFGRIGAQFLADKLGGKGNIICLNGTAGNTVNDSRWNGAEKVFAAHPGMKIVGTSYADWDYAKGKAAVESLLSANPKIDGVWSQGGAMTQGAIDAFNATGRELVPMVGEANNGLLKAWKQNAGKGKFDCIAPSNPAPVSVYALNDLISALNGTQFKKDDKLPIQSVTTETLDKYYRPDLPDSFWVFTQLTDANLKKLYTK